VSFGVRIAPRVPTDLANGSTQTVSVEAFNVTACDFELGMQGNCCEELTWVGAGATWRPPAAFLPVDENPVFELIFEQDVRVASPLPKGCTLPARGDIRMSFWRTAQNPTWFPEELEPKTVVLNLKP